MVSPFKIYMINNYMGLFSNIIIASKYRKYFKNVNKHFVLFLFENNH